MHAAPAGLPGHAAAAGSGPPDLGRHSLALRPLGALGPGFWEALSSRTPGERRTPAGWAPSGAGTPCWRWQRPAWRWGPLAPTELEGEAAEGLGCRPVTSTSATPGWPVRGWSPCGQGEQRDVRATRRFWRAQRLPVFRGPGAHLPPARPLLRGLGTVSLLQQFRALLPYSTSPSSATVKGPRVCHCYGEMEHACASPWSWANLRLVPARGRSLALHAAARGGDVTDSPQTARLRDTQEFEDRPRGEPPVSRWARVQRAPWVPASFPAFLPPSVRTAEGVGRAVCLAKARPRRACISVPCTALRIESHFRARPCLSLGSAAGGLGLVAGPPDPSSTLCPGSGQRGGRGAGRLPVCSAQPGRALCQCGRDRP